MGYGLGYGLGGRPLSAPNKKASRGLPGNPSHRTTTMTQPIPTVDDVLARTHSCWDLHEWGADGGVIRVTRAELRLALEAAYDPTTPNWPAMVEIEDA